MLAKHTNVTLALGFLVSKLFELNYITAPSKTVGATG